MFDLDAEEQRVLGTLIEKQLATPQYYPLTLTALVHRVQPDDVVASRSPRTPSPTSKNTLGRLRDKQLLRTILPSHGRSVDRYGHRLDEQITLIKEELALLGVLMLRGRADRERTEDADGTAGRLGAARHRRRRSSTASRNKPEPLVRNVGAARASPRTAGSTCSAPFPNTSRADPTRSTAALDAVDLDDLEARVAALEAEIAELREQLGG